MKTDIGRRFPRGLYALTVVPALVLAACGDIEPASDPTHQLAEAREAAERERSLRQVAEDRLGTTRRLAALGVGGAFAIGLAMGSSSRRKSDGADADGTEMDGAKTDV